MRLVRRWTLVTAVLVVAAAGGWRVVAGSARRAAAPVPAHGTIARWVLQFRPGGEPSDFPIYRDLLDATPPDARFTVAISEPAHEQDFRAQLGPHGDDPRLEFLPVRGLLSPWTRDGFIPFHKKGSRYVYVPWAGSFLEQERGGADVPPALGALPPPSEVVVGEYDIEGGDVLLSNRHVFIGDVTVRRICNDSAAARERFLRTMRSTFGREVIVVGQGLELPYDHIDMFLTVVDDATLLLGDPARAARILAAAELWKAGRLEYGTLGRYRWDTQMSMSRLYAKLVAQLRGHGYDIVRVPILHAERIAAGLRGQVLNWNNAVLEHRDGRGHAYVPHYGMDLLDDEAHATWRDLGFRVHPIRAAEAIGRGGAVRCLSQVVYR